MSRALLRYVDSVVDASMRPAARALSPLTRAIQRAIEGTDGYASADAALRRLEGTRADGLQEVLEGAMMNGTSGGSVDG